MKAIAAGILGGTTMATGHVFNAMSKGARFEGIPGADFFNRAYKYAEDNGLTARSIYDESPVHTSFSTIGQVGKALGKTISLPETYIRSMAFTTLAQFLKDSGKEEEIQTYAFNYYQQHAYFYREAKRGNPMPLITALAVQYAISGVMGMPGMEDAYKLLMGTKGLLPATWWAKVQENEFLREPKLWVLKNFGTNSAYGWLSGKTDLFMTSRVAAPSISQQFDSPLGPPTEIAKQIYSAGRALLDPTNTTKRAQAAMDLTPPGAQGMLETSPMMEGHTYNKRPDGSQEAMRSTKLEQRDGLVTRTPHDVAVRRLGLRTLNETMQRDVNYANKRDQVTAKENSKDLVDKFYDAVRRGDKADAADYYKTYAYINGSPISDAQFQSQVHQEFLTDSERSAKRVSDQGAKANLQDVLAMKRAKEIFDAVAKENQK
jgi:hypothetical protein